MAEGDLTIGIPGGGASDFAATPVPALTLNLWTRDAGAPMRSELGYAELLGRSNRGTPQISGPAYGITFSWPVAAMLTLDEALQLGALAKWQDSQYKAQNNGALRLVDEIEYLDPEPSPHSRSLLAALNPSWNAGYEYGYGVFTVKLQLPQDWKQNIGRWTDSGELARLATFAITEV
ncbi:MAG: hypothetical protein F6J95_023485 [Leptolyngbya sp. SIO1E4]|nr:hypothetical protein [Leptolyngbya sp. SIO1E4]